MAALAADRNTPRRANADFVYPVGAGKKIYAGAIVMLNAGNAEPGSTATGRVAVGVAERFVDNTSGAAGAVSVPVRRGLYRFANSASTDAIALTEVGTDCYVVDDQTVAKTSASSTRSVAGKVRDVDADGVWVEI